MYRTDPFSREKAMTRAHYFILIGVLILVTNIFFVSSNFYLIHKSNQLSERTVDKEDVTLAKLKQRVIEVTIPEYKTSVSNAMDQYIKRTSSENHLELESWKDVEKILNKTSVILACLNLVLLVTFWQCYLLKRTNPGVRKDPDAGAVS
jgi:hypothetical protein